MRKKITFFIIPGDAGKVRKVRISRTLLRLTTFALVLFFSFTCFLIYDYRTGIEERTEIARLREKASDQQLMLSFFEDKFKRVESELSRLRVIDSRIKKLIKVQEPVKKARRKRRMYVGGSEDAGSTLLGESRNLVDLRLDEIKKGILVNMRDMEGIKDMLELRREILESLPSIWPVRGVVSSSFGVRISPFSRRNVFHRGIDIMSSSGSEVHSSGSGKVIRSGYDADFGNVITVDHGYGYRTTYAHMSELFVRAGEIVKKGQVIGRVGTTGKSTGPHLHFEIRLNGVPVNPIRYLG